ncbi:HAD family hydrolase [Aquimarina aggregata]|uniref:HAD family hydrolase n=1 Tax=Aquimarina aggregata TaxID=1642818 RepID=UPI002492413D|nr:HAD-IA family hydrolase [Aquimarina aggregata]
MSELKMILPTKYDQLHKLTEPYDTIIFDVGDVILNWESKQLDASTNKINDLRQIIKHPLWQDLERGKINRDTAFSLLSIELNIASQKIKDLIHYGIKNLRLDMDLVNLIQLLSKKNKSIICLSNMDSETFSLLFSQYDFWNYFNTIYVSSLLNLNKPNSDIFEYLINQASLDVTKTIFIDDKNTNTTEANRHGISTITVSKNSFEYQNVKKSNSAQNVKLTRVTDIDALQNITYKARNYLFNRLRKFPLCRSYVGFNVELIPNVDFSKEIFSTAIVLDTNSYLPADIIDSMCEEINNHGHQKLKWCFYSKDARPHGFPDDLDTTSMILSCLLTNHKIAKKDTFLIAENMIANRNKEGIIQVYFDNNRPRVDAVVIVNVLYFMNQIGMNDRPELIESKKFIFNFLINKEYEMGTRYYPAPDVFLFFLSRLVSDFPNQFNDFKKPLRQKLIERIDISHYSLERALRVIALNKLGIVNRIDFIKLIEDQLADGGWPMYGLFIAAKSKKYFGSRELTTSFALEAIELMKG